MCGILAVYCKYEEQHLPEIVNAQSMLTNRGPDCSKLIIKPHVLGFTRLAIIDPTEKGMQPFEEPMELTDVTGAVLVSQRLPSPQVMRSVSPEVINLLALGEVQRREGHVGLSFREVLCQPDHAVAAAVEFITLVEACGAFLHVFSNRLVERSGDEWNACR